jgi:hypothetical protein
LRIVALFKLQQQAFPEVSRSDSGRFKILNNFEDLSELTFSSFDILKESKIINNVYKISSQVSIFVDIPENVFT